MGRGGDGWNIAAKHADTLGTIPNIFTATVRLLISDHSKNSQVTRPATKYITGLSMRGSKVLAMLYYASQQFKPGKIDDRKRVSVGDLIGLYQPFDLAVLYGTFLLYRRAIRGLELSRSEFQIFVPGFEAESQIGGLVGAALPRIGVGSGLLAGTVHHIAKLMLAVNQSAEVEKYNKYLAGNKLCWDLTYEFGKFGCTTLQIATLLLIRVGFPRRFAETYIGALDEDTGLGDFTSGILYPLFYGRIWIDGLVKSEKSVLSTMPQDYLPSASAESWMTAEIQDILAGKKSWIARESSDLSPTKTPGLFVQAEGDQPLPKDLQDIFSFHDIISMNDDEFDALIDKIDESVAAGLMKSLGEEKCI